MTGFDYKAELAAVRARIVADTNRRYTAAWDRIHAETPGERAEREPVTRPRGLIDALVEYVADFWNSFFGNRRE